MNVVELPKPELEIKLIPGADLHKWWDQVEHDIEECRVHDADDTWIQDVYTAIKIGAAQLFIGEMAGRYVGLCVTNMMTDPFSGRKKLNIWYLNCREGVDFLAQALPIMENIARTSGAEKLMFIASRDGFRKWGENLGFELAEIRMVKELY